MLNVFDLIYWFVLVLWCDAFVVIVLSDELMNQGRTKGEGWSTAN